MKLARRVLPWVVAAALLALLFARADVGAALAAVHSARWGRYLALALGFCALWLALDAFVLQRVFARAGAPLPFARMAWARAATYPWMVLSFDLANAALLAHLRRLTGAPLAGLGGALLVHYACDLLALASTALAGSLVLHDRFAAILRPFVLALALTAAGALTAARLGLARLARGPFAAALRSYSAGDLAIVIGLRAAFYASFALFVWSSLPCFALSAPFADVLARMPLVQSAAALPIAPGGLGTTQAAMLALFSGFGSEERWLAYSLVYGATLVAVRLPVGLAAWGFAARCQRRALEGVA